MNRNGMRLDVILREREFSKQKTLIKKIKYIFSFRKYFFQEKIFVNYENGQIMTKILIMSKYLNYEND